MAPFDHWTPRIAEATEPDQILALIREVGVWRARKLTDVPALRDGAFAMARLHSLAGDSAAALREAQSLVSLCKTPPEATDDELKSARAFLRAIGGTPLEGARPKKNRRKKERPVREAAAAQRDPQKLAAAGKWDQALEALGGRRGPRAELMRTWIRLARALGRTDVVERATELKALEGDLRAQMLGGETRESAPAAPSAESPDGPLEELVGRKLPRKRNVRMKMLEEFADSHPQSRDALAARALAHHVALNGPKRTAPWLVGLVARACAGDSKETRAALDKLAAQDVFAVTAYSEEPFERCVALLRAGESDGWRPVGVRRGVLRNTAEGVPPWTVRMARDGRDQRVAVCPSGLGTGSHANLAARLKELNTRLVWLQAEADPFAAAAREAGLEVITGDAATVLAQLLVEPAAAESSASPFDRLRDVLSTEAGIDREALVGVLGEFRRIHKAFGVARSAFESLATEATDAAAVILVDAMDEVAPDGIRLGEGEAMMLRAAARESSDARALLERPRFQSPDMEVLVGLVAPLQQAGWHLDRVLRGVTRREQREHGALEALSDGANRIWRLIVQRGEHRGEVWYLPADLPPEGRAAVPLLLSEARDRVVVLPVDADLIAWYGGLGGPEGIGWTGDEGGELVGAVEQWGAGA